MAGSCESSRTASEPPGSYELFPLKQGPEAERSYEPGGSDVVREIPRETAMFQIRLQGEALAKTRFTKNTVCATLIDIFGHS